jgi:hypothetical protein
MDWDPSGPPTASAAAPPNPKVPQHAELPATDHITLDVGGRKFHTRKSTLAEAPYFQNIFTGGWAIELLPDGSLPIDADPEIFALLFEYIRRPTVFPLLWTREKGFDYTTYNKLMAEADFFGLLELKEWIQERHFLKAVKTDLKMEIHPGRFDHIDGAGNHTFLHDQDPRYIEVEGGEYDLPKHNRDAINRTLQSSLLQPEDVELVHFYEVKIPSRGRYLCPSGNKDHVSPEMCVATECIPPLADDDSTPAEQFDYEQFPTSIVTVTKIRRYQPEVCLRGYVDPDTKKSEDE